MGARYLTDMAAVLRAAGLSVVEQEGWQTRARGSGGFDGNRPWCIMWHHAASSPGASAKSVADYGSYYSENKPVQNLVLGRDAEVWVCAAGATNTNGKGSAMPMSLGTVPLDQMNTHAIGIEAVNSGVGEPWPQVMVDAYFRLNNALCAAYWLAPTDLSSHAAYAVGRKIDPATAAAVQGGWRPRSINSSGTWNVDDMRGEALARAGTQPPEPSPPEPGKLDLMFTVIQVIDHPDELGGMADTHGIIAQVSWLNPQRSAAVKAAGAPIWQLSIGDVANCDLLGPLPPSFTRENFANVIT